MASRKPEPKKPPAEQLLNKFLKENGILIGLDQPPISKTSDGMVVVGKPNIIAVYDDKNKKAN
jgi:hypothetical protein